MTTDNSSLSVLMTYNMPSGTTKYCKSNSHSQNNFLSFFFPLLFPFLQMGWFKSTACDKAEEEPGDEASFHTKQQHFTLSSMCTSSSLFHNTEVSQCGSNRSQKHGFICDAIFFTCTHGHKAIITRDHWIRNMVSVPGTRGRESWFGGWTDALSVTDQYTTPHPHPTYL